MTWYSQIISPCSLQAQVLYESSSCSSFLSGFPIPLWNICFFTTISRGLATCHLGQHYHNGPSHILSQLDYSAAWAVRKETWCASVVNPLLESIQYILVTVYLAKRNSWLPCGWALNDSLNIRHHKRAGTSKNLNIASHLDFILFKFYLFIYFMYKAIKWHRITQPRKTQSQAKKYPRNIRKTNS